MQSNFPGSRLLRNFFLGFLILFAAAMLPAVSPGGEEGWKSGSSDYIVAQSRLHTFELRLAPEDLAFLDADPAAEEFVEGSSSSKGKRSGR